MSSRSPIRLLGLVTIIVPLAVWIGCSGCAGGTSGTGGSGGAGGVAGNGGDAGAGGVTGNGGAGGAEYELVFADEFDVGTSPSPANWTIETGYGIYGWGNNEWQLYTELPANVRVEDGNLVLSAQCPEAPCGVRDGSITSGKINSLGKFDFKFGKVEARIKPPVGEAAWPAFWSLGTNFPTIGWPRSGEIDFMEIHNAFSNERTTHFTMHWCDESVGPPEPCLPPEFAGWVYDSQYLTFDDSLGDDFHLFQAEWDENKIVGKIDGIVYFTKAIDPATMEEFLKEFYLILNVAMGGTLGSNNQPPNGTEIFPQTMLVDYVRVYQRVD
jgi:beta-glucanase (GH16 family)